MSKSARVRRFWSRGLAIFFLVLVAAGSGFFYWISRENRLDLVQTKLLLAILDRYRAQLPFEIEDIEFKIRDDSPSAEAGRGPRLRLVMRPFKGGPFRIQLSGPLILEKRVAPLGFRVRYSPEAQLEMLSAGAGGRSEPLALELEVSFSGELKSLQPKVELLEAQVLARSENWSWPVFGAKAEGLNFSTRWKGSLLESSFSARALSWSSPKSAENAFELKAPSLLASTALGVHPYGIQKSSGSQPLDVQHLIWGPEIRFELTGRSAEVLWGPFYLDLPWEELPFHGALSGVGTRAPRVELKIGPPQAPPLELRASAQDSREKLALRLDWKTASLPLKELVVGISKASPGVLPETLTRLGILQGRIRTQGRAEFDGKKEGARDWLSLFSAASLRALDGELSLEKIGLRTSGGPAALAVRNLQAQIPFSLSKGIPDAEISAEKILFQRLAASLGRTRFSIRPLGPPLASAWDIRSASVLPLQLEGIPLQLGGISGSYSRSDGLRLETSLELARLPLSTVLTPFCVTPGRLPPAMIEAHFPKIEITEDSIESGYPDGKVRAELFDGYVEVGELGAFDLAGEVPEVDFDLTYGGIRLDSLGRWLEFGKMDGVLAGYAHDVTFQSWLPTQYDFRLAVSPVPRRQGGYAGQVVFSAEAMKNFARLFAADAIDQLPGVADWIAFGPIKDFLGGYDVDYAGLELYSADGMIEVKTLDPPEVVKKEGKHFLLYAPGFTGFNGFKMPLNSSRYPLIVDATAMAKLVRRIALRAGSFKERKNGFDTEAQTEFQTEPARECATPDF